MRSVVVGAVVALVGCYRVDTLFRFGRGP